ncbi:uncharacterized protein I303_103680 [Kwoniella dejecticola CBS 10117]|uniref:Uncharacterized protein n=1 Tax=Kwoniella dejecticola CBS 10117 TaxID=1296121 RepID=A0A1A6A7E7_9TREE|nr:uncharacterized protein I303_03697 [Kwoniella dejecticola CBS 10117]OBR85982.1 hypothetical protein I303_03697 [Kwoniella dejecticola CBS 10117]
MLDSIVILNDPIITINLTSSELPGQSSFLLSVTIVITILAVCHVLNRNTWSNSRHHQEISQAPVVEDTLVEEEEGERSESSSCSDTTCPTVVDPGIPIDDLLAESDGESYVSSQILRSESEHVEKLDKLQSKLEVDGHPAPGWDLTTDSFVDFPINVEYDGADDDDSDTESENGTLLDSPARSSLVDETEPTISNWEISKPLRPSPGGIKPILHLEIESTPTYKILDQPLVFSPLSITDGTQCEDENFGVQCDEMIPWSDRYLPFTYFIRQDDLSSSLSSSSSSKLTLIDTGPTPSPLSIPKSASASSPTRRSTSDTLCSVSDESTVSKRTARSSSGSSSIFNLIRGKRTSSSGSLEISEQGIPSVPDRHHTNNLSRKTTSLTRTFSIERHWQRSSSGSDNHSTTRGSRDLQDVGTQIWRTWCHPVSPRLFAELQANEDPSSHTRAKHQLQGCFSDSKTYEDLMVRGRENVTLNKLGLTAKEFRRMIRRCEIQNARERLNMVGNVHRMILRSISMDQGGMSEANEDGDENENEIEDQTVELKDALCKDNWKIEEAIRVTMTTVRSASWIY